MKKIIILISLATSVVFNVRGQTITNWLDDVSPLKFYGKIQSIQENWFAEINGKPGIELALSYTFNEEGLCIQLDKKNEGNWDERYEIDYDKNRNKSEVRLYNKEKLNIKVVYNRDSSGKILNSLMFRDLYYEDSGELIFHMERKYFYNVENKVIEIVNYTALGIIREGSAKFTYDSRGNIIKEQIDNHEPFEYDYDHKNNPIRVERKNGKILLRSIYTYDKYGNWTTHIGGKTVLAERKIIFYSN